MIRPCWALKCSISHKRTPTVCGYRCLVPKVSAYRRFNCSVLVRFFACFVLLSTDQHMIQIDGIKRIKYNEMILDAFKMKMKRLSSEMLSAILHEHTKIKINHFI